MKHFLRYFKNLPGQIVVTNFRVLFIPKLEEIKYKTLMDRQPHYVKEYFNVPFGFINRCERTVNIYNDPNKKKTAYDNNLPQNFIEIYTKDNRYFKLIFGNLEGDICNELWHTLDKHLFVDINIKEEGFILPKFTNTFPYHHVIDINDQNWTQYKDGWQIYENIAQDATRMGIDLTKSKEFRVFKNNGFYCCATYPSMFIVPRQMQDT